MGAAEVWVVRLLPKHGRKEDGRHLARTRSVKQLWYTWLAAGSVVSGAAVSSMQYVGSTAASDRHSEWFLITTAPERAAWRRRR